VLPRLLPHWFRRAKLVTGHTAATCSGGSRFNSVALSPRLTDPLDQPDLFSSQPKPAGKLAFIANLRLLVVV
jgi:hypothetical protein